MSRINYSNNKPPTIQQELDQVSELLSSVTHQVTHEVPEGFWEEQRSNIFSHIHIDSPIISQHVSKRNIYKRIFVMAAAAILLVLVWLQPMSTRTSQSMDELNSLELAALEEYLLDEVSLIHYRISLEETFYEEEFWNLSSQQNENDH